MCLTNVVYVAFTVVVLLAGHDGVHAARLAFEGCDDSSISATALDLHAM